MSFSMFSFKSLEYSSGPDSFLLVRFFLETGDFLVTCLSIFWISSSSSILLLLVLWFTNVK